MNLLNGKVVLNEQTNKDYKRIIVEVDGKVDKFGLGKFCYLKFKELMPKPYSIASVYNELETENQIEFYIKKMDGGKVSSYVHDELSVGENIGISLPIGGYPINDGDEEEKILFICGGSGITMVKSFIKEHVLKAKNSLHLIYGVKNEDEILFLDHFKENNELFTYEIFVSNQENTKYNKGFITKESIVQANKKYSFNTAILIGPEPMVEKMISFLKEINFTGKIYE